MSAHTKRSILVGISTGFLFLLFLLFFPLPKMSSKDLTTSTAAIAVNLTLIERTGA